MFYFFVNVSGNCSLSTFPNDTQPLSYKDSECISNPLTNLSQWCIITLPGLIRA
ncbi:gp87 [Synechococcus phage syn9]|uniref:Gp87 n=1 Tax=Synechococcus phage syn9 TaxID=382359 RepID=Q0QZE1_BPSYS|nr:gp87 [Synechococcus phage syn9]ABA47056.1 gp87 [Synechococcus phage syn9]